MPALCAGIDFYFLVGTLLFMSKAFLAVFLFALLCSAPVFASQLEILSLDSSSTIPSKIYAGDLVTLNLNVKNTSGTGQAASNINIALELNENDFTAVKALESIDSIGSRSTKTVSLRFKAKENVLPGTYKVPVRLTYFSGSDLLEQIVTVDVSISSCNFLNIESIDLGTFQPHIGSDVDIVASVKNTCANAARNVTVKLNPVTNATIEPFVVTSGTLKKIGDILPGESKTAEFSMSITDKVAAKTYVFSVDANCDSCQNTSNSFSFLVLGQPDLVFSNIEYSVDNPMGGSEKEIIQGSTFVLSVQIDNIGEEKARAVDVEVDFAEGTFSGTTKAFLGNIDPDDSGAAIFNLRTNFEASSGEQKGVIRVSYTDELGEPQVFVEDYSLYITPLPPTSPIVYIIILVLLLAVIGAVYFLAKFIFRQLALRKSK
ncbi:MAG: hypothetical protein NUV67_03360 [archaeon]|nr:hypothetical protein [archaeon]